MDIKGWDERYRAKESTANAAEATPTKLLVDSVRDLQPGSALDLACGTGRNALWLASQGWNVKGIDGSTAAIDVLRQRARQQGLSMEAEVEDLQDTAFSLPENKWDLIAICYYLQRDLMERAKQAVKPGGTIIVIVHTTEGDEQPTESRLRPGELEQYFLDWNVTHRYEGQPDDPAHRRRVAEVVALRPL